MEKLLREERFNFISKENKKFICEFTKQMKNNQNIKGGIA